MLRLLQKLNDKRLKANNKETKSARVKGKRVSYLVHSTCERILVYIYTEIAL